MADFDGSRWARFERWFGRGRCYRRSLASSNRSWRRRLWRRFGRFSLGVTMLEMVKAFVREADQEVALVTVLGIVCHAIVHADADGEV